MFQMRQLLLMKKKRELSEYKAIYMIKDYFLLLFQTIQNILRLVVQTKALVRTTIFYILEVKRRSWVFWDPESVYKTELLHQKASCISKMVYVAEQRAEYNIIRSLPGIGPNTAVRLMAERGDITRFNNNKQLNAFAGIDIRRFQSGKTFFKDKINKRGNKHLRKLLFLIIQNMIKQRRYGQNRIFEYYDKLKTQPYNKCHKVASIACVNKLLKLLFYLITHNMHYDYRLTA
ncbi:ISSep1-like transposase [Bacillus mycoides]|uniref:ISSep1-like transposase n=1 Tax=Bacillus mycoides TaxID=1405 RepID=C2Y2U3_BACMY|nr:ISSep1-like transposase [Bacillus mycoides]